MEHTKEPWAYESGAIRIESDQRWKDPIRLESAWREDAWEGDEVAEANARRIVDCVNALAGIENPAAYVAAMGACVEAGAGFVAALTSDGENRHGSITVDHVRLTACIAVMEAALATARATMEKVNG